jgi:hypothetical protein
MTREREVAAAAVRRPSWADVCGNFGGWQPFTTDELARLYGYRERYDALVAQGFGLRSERDRAIELARRAFSAAG